MLSLSDIRKILRSGKPVVWTMHDIWPATAICHLTLQCKNYKSRCHHCRLLPGGGSANDLSASTWRRKEQTLRDQNIFFVACSRWLAGEAKSSALLRGQKITCIPNPIDTRIYHPREKAEARRAYGLPADKKLLLFVAQRATNQNKGMDYLVEACKTLAITHGDSLGVIILGGHADEVSSSFTLPVYPLGYVTSDDELTKIYSAADVFVLPSLSENLPNTIMEAMACGVPCVGFNVGGIPEEIDHLQNGYVAQYRDAADLARGIEWVLGEAHADDLRQQCLRKVAHTYSQSAIALRYVEVYNQALALKHYKL
jgi:glycosyltransferase involved in cell wall biosynthesis